MSISSTSDEVPKITTGLSEWPHLWRDGRCLACRKAVDGVIAGERCWGVSCWLPVLRPQPLLRMGGLV